MNGSRFMSVASPKVAIQPSGEQRVVEHYVNTISINQISTELFSSRTPLTFSQCYQMVQMFKEHPDYHVEIDTIEERTDVTIFCTKKKQINSVWANLTAFGRERIFVSYSILLGEDKHAEISQIPFKDTVVWNRTTPNGGLIYQYQNGIKQKYNFQINRIDTAFDALLAMEMQQTSKLDIVAPIKGYSTDNEECFTYQHVNHLLPGNYFETMYSSWFRVCTLYQPDSTTFAIISEGSSVILRFSGKHKLDIKSVQNFDWDSLEDQPDLQQIFGDKLEYVYFKTYKNAEFTRVLHQRFEGSKMVLSCYYGLNALAIAQPLYNAAKREVINIDKLINKPTQEMHVKVNKMEHMPHFLQQFPEYMNSFLKKGDCSTYRCVKEFKGDEVIETIVVNNRREVQTLSGISSSGIRYRYFYQKGKIVDYTVYNQDTYFRMCTQDDRNSTVYIDGKQATKTVTYQGEIEYQIRQENRKVTVLHGDKDHPLVQQQVLVGRVELPSLPVIEYAINVEDIYEYRCEYLPEGTEEIEMGDNVYRFDVNQNIQIGPMFTTYGLLGGLRMLISKFTGKGYDKELKSVSKKTYDSSGIQLSEQQVDDNNRLKIKEKNKTRTNGIVAWKAARTLDNEMCIIKLLIPKNAKTVWDTMYEKYRANRAVVQAILPVTYQGNNYYFVNDLKAEPCGVCLEEIANCIAVPCRHRLCSECWEELINFKDKMICHYCRQDIQSVHRMETVPGSQQLSLPDAMSCVHTSDFKYTVGEELVITDFCSKQSKTCGPGIHYQTEQKDVFRWFEYMDIPKELQNKIPESWIDKDSERGREAFRGVQADSDVSLVRPDLDTDSVVDSATVSMVPDTDPLLARVGELIVDEDDFADD